MDEISNFVEDFTSNWKDNFEPIVDFILNETPRGFDTEPTLNPAAHLETMRHYWEVRLDVYYRRMSEVLRIIEEFDALERGGSAKSCINSNILQIAMLKTKFDPELVATIFNKYLLPKDAVLPMCHVCEKVSAASLDNFEACLFCTALFYKVWHLAAVRNVAACPAGLVLHMAEVSLSLSESIWSFTGLRAGDTREKALIGSQKARKSGAKALRGVVFDAICAKKPDWFRRYGVSMGSVAKDLIRETKIDRTPKQVIKYIRDGLSRGDFADTGLEEVLREIYCKILKKGNLL